MRSVLAFIAACGVVVSAGVATAAPRNVIVFFTEWSAQIDAPAVTAIREAADLAGHSKAGVITVIGYADTTGSKKAAALMSATRAQVVVDALVADGLPRQRIRIGAEGATTFVETPLDSHRVKIVVPVS